MFSAHEMLQAYIAERLDRMIDHMISRGSSRLAVFGSRTHAHWLHEHIDGVRTLPLTAFIDRPDELQPAPEIGIPVLQIDDQRLADLADTVLIADDRSENVLYELALRHVQPGITLFRLYHRLPIGNMPLGPSGSSGSPPPSPNSVVEAKSGSLVGYSENSAVHRLSRLATVI